MIIEKKIGELGLNSDDNLRDLPDGAFLNAMNCRFGVTEFGRDKRWEMVSGHLLVQQSVYPPYGVQQTIGGCVDIFRNYLIYFNWNSVGDHGIYCYVPSTGITYAVLYDSQIIGGLNFSKTSRIDRNARVVGDLLIWTDDNEETKCINYIAGIRTNSASFVTDVLPYSWPIKYETTTLIKRPPIYRLQAVKATDSSFENNLIKNKAYQFTYRYQFRDRQISVFAAYSQLMPFNAKEEASNSIDVNVSFSEYIDDDVQQVDIAVRYGNVGDTFVVKRYNKNNTADRNAILAHNAGATALGLTFYDDIVGERVNDVDANTPYDGVPLRIKTFENARNRLFPANFLSGYDTPTESSLAVTLTNINTGATGDFAGTWGYITLHANYVDTGIQDEFMFPFVRRTSDNTLYYFPSVRNSSIWNGGVGSVPATVNLSDATFSAGTEANLVAYLKATNFPTGGSVGTPTWEVAYDISFASLGSGVTVFEFQPISVNQFFKDNSTYLVSIAFFDRFRRKCGVIKNPVQVSIPIRTYSQTQFTTILQWALSNANAANEIPDWAYYYQIHITKNQTTRFFVQARVYNSTYAIKNSDDTYTYGNGNFSDKTAAVAFDISTLTNYGQGWTYEEGDMATVTFISGDPITLPLIGQDGNNILLQSYDFGFGLNIDTAAFLELYKPYKPGLSEAYYEAGDMIPISNPASAQRAYSQLVGQINGDTYALQRMDKNEGLTPNQLYIVESMSPNDAMWKIWETDTGWPNFFDNIGQVRKTQAIAFSDTYVLGSNINGINKFQFANQQSVDAEMGAIQKVQLSTKSQEQGTIMLVVGTRQTASAYLGEVQLVGAAQNAFVAQSPGIIGTINILHKELGTTTPETVVPYRGLVFWIDTSNGKVVQYSVNGLDVQNWTLTRFWQRYCKAYVYQVSQHPGNMDNINGFHHIPTGVDAYNKEVLFTLPGVTYPNYATTLPSYSSVPSYASSIISRFDIFDSLGKTMALRFEENKWGSTFEFMAEFYESIQNITYGFKNGYLYSLYGNSGAFNNFFGTQYPMRLCGVANLNKSMLKDLSNIAIEGNTIPDFTVAMTNYPNQQITDLTEDDYSDEEGNLYASFFRDRLSPNASGTADQKLYTGDQLTDIAPMWMIEFSQYNSLIYVNAINIGFEISKGQKQIANQSNK